MWKLAAGVGTTVAALYLTKCYFSGGVCKCKTRLDGQVVIITGANSGIGKETALQLAKRGAVVILACRDAKKGEETRQFIAEQVDAKAVICSLLDLSSFRSIRNFVDRFYTEYGADARLDILINNAGVFHHPPETTDDGFDLTYQVNYLGAVLLTVSLLPALKRASPSRVIFVSSQAVNIPTELNIETLGAPRSPENGDHILVYGQSKLAQLLFVRKLASALVGSAISVNAGDPGNVRTDILRHYPLLRNPWLAALSWPLRWLTFKSKLQGVQTIIHLALDPAVEDAPSGHFYRLVASLSDRADFQTLLRSRLVEKRLPERGTAPSRSVRRTGEQAVVLQFIINRLDAGVLMDRTILQAGKPGQRAFLGWQCRIHVKKIDILQSAPVGYELQEGQQQVKIGNGDTEILRSLEKILPLMNCDEIAHVTLHGRKGGLLRCEITLLEIIPPEEFLGLDDEQRLRNALEHKDRAASLFKQNRFVDAFHRFSFGAKELMSTETVLLDQEETEIQPTLSKLFSNMAECQLRMANWEAAVDLANRALAYQPKDVKALFRAASGSWSQGDTDKANAYLDRLLEVEPHNVAALRLRAEVSVKVAEYEKEYEAMMKRVFAMY